MLKIEKLIADKGFNRKNLDKIQLEILCELQDVIDLASLVDTAQGSQSEKMKNASVMISNVEGNADHIFALCYTYNGSDVSIDDIKDNHIPTKQIATTVLLEPIMQIFADSVEEDTGDDNNESGEGKTRVVGQRN